MELLETAIETDCKSIQEQIAKYPSINGKVSNNTWASDQQYLVNPLAQVYRYINNSRPHLRLTLCLLIC